MEKLFIWKLVLQSCRNKRKEIKKYAKIRLSMGGAKKRPVYKIGMQIADFQEMEDLLKK